VQDRRVQDRLLRLIIGERSHHREPIALFGFEDPEARELPALDVARLGSEERG
jgi:hypothetical protein